MPQATLRLRIRARPSRFWHWQCCFCGSAAASALLGRFAVPHHLGLPAIFLAFLKLGSVVYGSGYVFLAFLFADLVARREWITSAQLMIAVAVGQVTYGPEFPTATFIGYLLAGQRSALVATLGMFLPARTNRAHHNGRWQ